MPFNPQPRHQFNWCQEILAKFVKQEEISQNSVDSQISPDGIEIAEGKWEDDQNLKFIVFVDFHAKIFSSKQKRKSQKIFKSLSKYLGNRTPAQCRSHYQKIMIKFKTIAKLKRHFREYFGEELYNKEFRDLTEFWAKENPQPQDQKVPKQVKIVKEIGIQTEPMIEMSLEYQQMWMMWQMHMWNRTFFPLQMNFYAQEKDISN